MESYGGQSNGERSDVIICSDAESGKSRLISSYCTGSSESCNFQMSSTNTMLPNYVSAHDSSSHTPVTSTTIYSDECSFKEVNNRQNAIHMEVLYKDTQYPKGVGYDSSQTLFIADSDNKILVDIDNNNDKKEKTKDCTSCINSIPNDAHSVYVPIPNSLMIKTKSRKSEFSKLRYTRVIGDPSEFIDRRYTLRIAKMGKIIEMFIVITMFNEDVDMFIKTWDSIIKNTAYLCSKKLHSKWGPNGWGKIAVCVVADGWRNLSPRTLSLFGAIGLFKDEFISYNGHPNLSGHMFEVTTQLRLMKTDSTYVTKQAPFPIQTILFLKEHNTRKINSHRWFLDAFCRSVKPRLCAMIDVGTRIGTCSFYEVWKEFNKNPKVGGVCGELCVDTGSMGLKLTNFLVAAQNFEYNSSNILDKPIESLFGYVNVLPGAFSVYKYEALKPSPGGCNPLDRYFSGDISFKKSDSNKDSYLRKANTYLAEDRILGFEVISNSSKDWILSFVKSAKAYTDVPETVAEFLAQRRRWMNGSFFASLYVTSKALYIFKTKHSFLRKLSILCIIAYNTIDVIFCWLQPSNCYISFYYLSVQLFENTPINKLHINHLLLSVVNYVYIFSLFIALITSLSVRPHGSRFMYRACMFTFSSIVLILIILGTSFMGYGIYLKIYSLFREPLNSTFTTNSHIMLPKNKFKYLATDIELVAVVLCIVHIFCCVLYGQVSHIITSFAQYILFLPSRANVLMTYAYCNIHDTTWGTKGLSDKKSVDPSCEDANLCPDVQIRNHTSLSNDRELIQSCPFLSFLNRGAENYEPKTPSIPNNPHEDYPLLFRAKVVIPWILSNVIFSIIVVKEKLFLPANADRPSTPELYYYLVFVTWLLIAINSFKALGSVVYHLSLLKADILRRFKI